MTGSYAGDVTPRDAWTTLEQDPGAVLIDVRTKPEWSYVGVPDLAGLGKTLLKIEWQSWPDGGLNQDFAAEVAAGRRQARPADPAAVPLRCPQQVGGAGADRPGLAALLQYLRRLRGSASMSTKHRGSVAGWQHDGLPWIQG